MQQMDTLQCKTLEVVCRTLIKEQQNVSVFAGHFHLQAEQPLSKSGLHNMQPAAPGKIFSGPGAISKTAPGPLKNHLSKLIGYNKT
jgi:hypothetical protein